MKKKYLFSAFALALALVGCDYNEKYFEGLDEMTAPTEVFAKEYALTDADYATIANNSANKSIATANGVSDQLAAIKTTLRFTNAVPGTDYIPAFLAAKYRGADNGSAVKVTYNEETDVPAYVAKIAAAKKYTLVDADYAAAWSNGEANYYTPEKPAASYLSAILKDKISDPVVGDYALATYKYSPTEPVIDNPDNPDDPEDPEEQFDDISTVAAAGAGEHKVKGTVIAAYDRGFLIQDKTGSILVYKSNTGVNVGDEVKVEGTTSKYGGFMQFPGASEVTYIGKSESYAAPTYTALDATGMEAMAASPELKFVSFTGTLKISGNFNNVVIDGTTAVQGSLSYPGAGIIDPALNNQKITAYGYVMNVTGGSSTKFVNIATTKVVPEGEERSTIADAALGATGTHTVQGAVVATYAQGFLLGDGANNILVYKSNTGVAVGDIVKVSGTTSTYSGFTQFPAAATVTKTESTTTITHPTAAVLTADDLTAYPDAPYKRYVSFTGKLNQNGNFYNIEVDGTAVQGSILGPNTDDAEALKALNGKNITVTGYAVYPSGSNTKYLNVMVTSYAEATAASVISNKAATPANLETLYALYQYTSNGWTAATDAAVVQPADYKAMGQSYNNFSAAPDAYMPAFLKNAFPYAVEGDTKAAVYYLYANSTTSTAADEYVMTDGNWVKNGYVQTVTKQFALSNGVWRFNPSVIITLPYGKNMEPSTTYYQAITNWVIENYPDYVTSYKNNDYYYGGSAYQGDFDFRPSAWRQYGYDNLTDDQLTALMWERLPESFPHALEVLNADMEPIPDVDVTATINFVIYNGGNLNYTIQYKCVSKGKFEYVEGSLKQVD